MWTHNNNQLESRLENKNTELEQTIQTHENEDTCMNVESLENYYLW